MEVKVDAPRYTCKQEDELQTHNVRGEKGVIDGSICNDHTVTKLKNRLSETTYTFVVNVKKSQRIISKIQ